MLVDLRRRALLADFGLSRAVQEGPSGLTTSHGLKGTLRYYSPELLSEENAKLTLQSDVWAWACLGVEVSIAFVVCHAFILSLAYIRF